jgi:hypothetical protein
LSVIKLIIKLLSYICLYIVHIHSGYIIRSSVVLVIFYVRKNAVHEESSQEKSHVQEQGLMACSNCQAGQEKMAQR